MPQPQKPDDLYQEGLRLLAKAKPKDAEQCFREALRSRSNWAEARNNLGVALSSLARYAEALAAFDQAVRLKPDYAEAHHNLGNSLRRAGRAQEALEHYREALRLRPGWTDVLNNLGVAFRQLGKADEALVHFRQALVHKPDHAEARNNLGVALADQGKLAEAAAVYRQVLKLKPNAAETHNNLGVILVQQGKLELGIERYRRALEIKPDYPDAHNNLGNALRQQGELDQAEASLRQALRLKPEYAEAYNNLAIVLVKQGRVDEAVPNYLQAIRLKTDYPDAHKNLALAWLARGDYREGFTEYEWRWKTKDFGARSLDKPRWDGSVPARGAGGLASILVYAEQGLGDTIQFIRYVPLVAQRGLNVLLECPTALHPLLAGFPGVSRLVASGDAGPAGKPDLRFDLQAPLLSLASIFQTTPETIPNQPYLRAEPERVARWRDELKKIPGFKIGIGWQGSPRFHDDRFRSVPLASFAPLAKIAGVRLVSLQKGHGVEQLGGVKGWNVVDFGNKLDGDGAFLDTAALMTQLDLVITSDTAIAHLAGALGVRAWVALGKAADWRWLLEREDSPWYPSLRLFRQKTWGDWAEVFERMAYELQTTPPLESADVRIRLATDALNQEKYGDAAGHFQRALGLSAGAQERGSAERDAVAHNNLAVALDKLGQSAEALDHFAEAARLKPDYADALHNLGNMLRRQGQLEEAEASYRQALKLQPTSPDLCNHLGITLLGQEKHAEAEACFKRALRLRPEHAEAHNNLGVLYEQLGRLDEAASAYQESLRIKPDSADTHKNLALAWLMRGQYARGWTEYEWRFKTAVAPARSLAQPRWDGRALEGESVLLYSEQGLGDAIQFVRYAEMARQRGAVVLVECPGSLVPLLSRCPGIDRLIPQGGPLPDFAYEAPFLSLPGIFQTTLETVPGEIPYLSAEPLLIERWGEELEGMDDRAQRDDYGGHHAPRDGDGRALRIGIAWQGSVKYQGDRHRSIPLAAFAPVAESPGVRLVSLQKGFGTEQLKELGPRWQIIDFGDRLDADAAFLDTAAILRNLDLVICSDTSVAHLAGALGVPVWVALGQAADWRWLRQRRDTPWYPTMALFRQTKWGDWEEVFRRMAEELKTFDNRITHGAARKKAAVTISREVFAERIAALETARASVADDERLGQIRMELGGLLAEWSRSFKSG
jgi:Flp pilus assembly protein TadD